VFNFEQGRRDLSVSDLILVARALNVDPERLFRRILNWSPDELERQAVLPGSCNTGLNALILGEEVTSQGQRRRIPAGAVNGVSLNEVVRERLNSLRVRIAVRHNAPTFSSRHLPGRKPDSASIFGPQRHELRGGGCFQIGRLELLGATGGYSVSWRCGPTRCARPTVRSARSNRVALRQNLPG
jgi:hypothetical protein